MGGRWSGNSRKKRKWNRSKKGHKKIIKRYFCKKKGVDIDPQKVECYCKRQNRHRGCKNLILKNKNNTPD